MDFKKKAEEICNDNEIGCQICGSNSKEIHQALKEAYEAGVRDSADSIVHLGNKPFTVGGIMEREMCRNAVLNLLPKPEESK